MIDRQHRLFALAFALSLLIHTLALAWEPRSKVSSAPLPALMAQLRQMVPLGDTAAPVRHPSRPSATSTPHRKAPPAIVHTDASATRVIADSTAPTNAALPATGPAVDDNSTLTAPLYRAAYLDNPRPAYPLAARRRGLEGTVHIDVLVSRDGVAREIRVKTTSGTNDLDESALAAVRRWRFVPARRGAEAVEGWITVPIRFQLEDAI